MKIFRCIILAGLCWTAGLRADEVVINEFMARNNSVLQDAFGVFSDWIELHNRTNTAVDLTGWYLTDSSNELTKWMFPSTNIPANGYLVVFASDNDTNFMNELHTNFKLARDGEYLALVRPDGTNIAYEFAPVYPPQESDFSYGIGAFASNVVFVPEFAPVRALVPTADIGTTWVARTGFDDSVWIAGNAGVGYEQTTGFESLIGIDVESDLFNLNGSVYLRMPFVVTSTVEVLSLDLKMKFDDGFMAYLNGQLIAQSNAPGVPFWNSLATAAHADFEAVKFQTFSIANPSNRLVQGTNILAIHGMNQNINGSDMLASPKLEGLIETTNQTESLRFYAVPTPGAMNSSAFLDFVKDTKFNPDRGFYTNSVSVTITSKTDGAVIRYTIDGSAPTETSGFVFTNALTLTNTTVLRAAAFKPGWRPTEVDAHSYFFLNDIIHATNPPPGYPASWVTRGGTSRAADYEMDPDIVDDPVYGPQMEGSLLHHPTISIGIDINDMFDSTNGIYANPGETADSWERAVSAEFMNFPGEDSFQANCALRIYGNASRSLDRPKHNMRFVFKSKYGPGSLNYPAFTNSLIARFNGIQLRGQNGDSWIHPTGSQRTDAQMIRDQVPRDMQLAIGMPSPDQDHVHLYVNGIYWGFYHTIERIDDNLMAKLFGGEQTDYDVLKAVNQTGVVGVRDGDTANWEAMQALGEAGVTNEAQYQAIRQYADIENLIDFLCINFYNGNSDWDRNNWLAATHRTNGSGFKFFVWDSERSFLGVTQNSVTKNNVNMPTRLHNNLLGYGEYRLQFADHVQRHFFNGGLLTKESVADLWNRRAEEIRLSLVAESARWGDHHRPAQPYTPDNEWQTKLDFINNTYFPQRTDIVVNQLKTVNLYPPLDAPGFSQSGGGFSNLLNLSITATSTVYFSLDGSDPRQYLTGVPAGSLYTNTIALDRTIRVKARALNGTNWSALVEALFVNLNPFGLRISEVMYHPHPDPSGLYLDGDFEFIELVNTGSEVIGLDGLRFTEGITFDFSAASNLILAPGEHIVVVKNLAAFTNRYPNPSIRIAGEFSGSLNDNGEQVVLEAPLLGPFISFEYEDGRGWPLTPDGAGHALVPLLFDNQTNSVLDYGGNWRAGTYRGGSPGEADPAPIISVLINELAAHTDTDMQQEKEPQTFSSNLWS